MGSHVGIPEAELAIGLDENPEAAQLAKQIAKLIEGDLRQLDRPCALRLVSQVRCAQYANGTIPEKGGDVVYGGHQIGGGDLVTQKSRVHAIA